MIFIKKAMLVIEWLNTAILFSMIISCYFLLRFSYMALYRGNL